MGALFKTTQEREQERAEKRHALMAAAARMFNENGFHTTSLKAVAASLDATKPSVYHYLGNKDQLLLECVRYGLQQMLDAANVATQATRSGVAFDHFLEEYALLVMGDFGGCVARTGDELLSPTSKEEFIELKGQLHAKICELVSGVEPKFPAEQVDLLARLIIGAITGITRWHPLDTAPDRSVARDIAKSIRTLVTG